MGEDDKVAGSRDQSRIRRWSRSIQGQLLKATEHTETVVGLAENAGEKFKLYLDTPTAQKIIATATSEPAKKIAIGSLYLLLPRPIRWAIKQDFFEKHVRLHVFREGAGSLQIPDQSQATSMSDSNVSSESIDGVISDTECASDVRR